MPRNGKAMACGGGGGSGGGGGAAALDLQTEEAIMKDGVMFDVRYIGCLEIKSSMKTLEFSTRSHVAK